MSLRVLGFGALHGFLFAVCLFLAMMSMHEDAIYDQIVDNVLVSDMSEADAVVRLTNATHELLASNHQLIALSSKRSFRERYFASADVQLLAPKGHCGSYAHVLARLLQRAGFSVRLAQMDCSNNERSCHIFVEALVDGRYVALDGMYNLALRRRDGQLASSADIRKEWTYYRSQLPSDYPLYFDYYSIRYTNWEKIPFVMPAVKSALNWVMGSRADTLSLRPYFLNVYKVYLCLLGGLYMLSASLIIFLTLRRRKRARQYQQNS